MSRIGNTPIPLPPGVTAELTDHHLTVKGPRGQLSRHLPQAFEVTVQEHAIIVRRPSDSKQHRSLHGLIRSLIAGMVEGVNKGFVKTLELYGVGFRIQHQAPRLNMQLGFSHPVVFELPDGISAQVETFVPTGENNYLSCRITLSGIDKGLLGETAAKLRATRKPEPYKGKGFRYQGERIRRKPGKAAQAATVR